MSLRFAKFSIVVLASALLLCACHEQASTSAEPAAATAPGAPDPYSCRDCNIVLISIDTLRADHLGCYGYPRATSPALDELAAESLLFERAISQSAWTTPAHASMMTGLLPSEHGLLYYKTPGSLAGDSETLARVLTDHGYRTAGFHGNGYVASEFGIHEGFETYRSRGHELPDNVSSAIAWLDDLEDQKFFLFLHGFDVHKPYLHRETNSFFDFPGAAEMDLAAFCRGRDHQHQAYPQGSNELKYIIAQYDAGIRSADGQVKQLLDYLKQRSLLDNTIVVITSDHGDGFFEHGRCDHTETMYSEVINVPLIIRMPSRTAAREARPVAASQSLFPTLTRAVGITGKGDTRFDLMALLRDSDRSQLPILSETGVHMNGLFYWRAAIAGRYKLLYAYSARHVGGKPLRQHYELYDWQLDPQEATDLAGEHPEVVEELKKFIFSGANAGGDAPLPTALSRRQVLEEEALKEQLRALGYVDD